MDVPQADTGIDVGMGAHAGRAVGQKGAGQSQGTRLGIVIGRTAPVPLMRDPLRSRWADGVAMPRGTPGGFVEMRVPLDQPRQQQGAAAVDDLRVVGACGDPAVPHMNVGRCAAERPDVADCQAG